MGAGNDSERLLARADEAAARLDVDALIAHLSAAMRELTAAGEPRRAAMVSVRLGQVYENALCNLTAARAWFSRAARLIEDEPPCLEQGWVAIAAMGCDVDDPAALLRGAELALERARRFGDVNLETKALADAGLAHVQSGRTAQGMALLDEAMALACGPANDSGVASSSACSFFTACYHAGDFERASSWTGPLEQHGLLGPAPGAQIFLSSHCDSVQASLLMELGRWGEAEAVLQRSIGAFEAVMPFPAWHPAITLADLRVRQGRLQEAEALLLGKDQLMQALLPAARMHLARGDAALAKVAAQRGLRCLGRDRLRAIELYIVSIEASLALGDHAAAALAAAELSERTRGLQVPSLEARAALARAKLTATRGDYGTALQLLEPFVDRLDAAQTPWLRALCTIELARYHDALDDRAAAQVEARAALALLSSLDVVRPTADQALLEGLGGAAAGGARRTRIAKLGATDKWWTVSCGNVSVRLPEGKGMRYLAELVRCPGIERHALDLVDRIEGLDVEQGIDRRSLGSLGPSLDARARAEYRERIERLRCTAVDAMERGQLEAAEAAQTELDQLVAQLAHAFGLGGRDRPGGSAAERARLNVTRALRTAIERIGQALPEAGQALDRHIKTGLYCGYFPTDSEISWIVQSGVNGAREL
jgi:hypothetical protein